MGELNKVVFELFLVLCEFVELFHELVVVGFHIPKDDEFLGIDEELHFDDVELILKRKFNVF